jgi:hypothetical protein
LLPQSGLLPDLDLDDLAVRIRTASIDDQTAAVEAYREWLREQ